jgi:hypothetical protein
LGGVEACSCFVKLLAFSQVPEKFSSIKEIHDEIKLCLGLKRVKQSYDEWAAYASQNFTFGLSLDDQVSLSNHSFV